MALIPKPKTSVHRRWWEFRGADMAKAVFSNINHLADENKRFYENMERDASVYSNRPILGLTARQYHKNARQAPERITMNLTKSAIDAVVAKIAKNTPKASFVTSGGDFTLQKKAKRLDKFVEGVFYGNDVPQLGPMVARDAMVFHSGWLKVYANDGSIEIERAYPWEVLADPQEALYASPRSLYQYRYVDADVLRKLFPGKEAAVKNAGFVPVYDEDRSIGEELSNQVTVVEAWHLPSAKGAKDGVHVVSVDGAVLVREAWNIPHFPLVSLHWECPKPMLGIYGASAIHEVSGIQAEINHLLRDIQQRYHLCSRAWILSERGNNASPIENESGTWIEFDAGTTPPTIITFDTTSQEVYNHLQALKQDLFTTLGVSQLSAQSMKPAGLDSGKALRDFHDIETERFAIFARSYEEFFKDLAQVVVAVSRKAADDGDPITVSNSVKRRRRTVVEHIKWEDVSLEDDQFELKVFPASMLPSHPAGRLATVEQLVGSGMIGREQGMALLEFPDVEEAMRLELAPYDIVLDQLEMILDDDERVIPEPFQDLQLAMRMGQQAYMRAKIDKAPPETLELLRLYIDGAESQLSAAAPVGPEPPGGAPPGPLAGQEAPPPGAAATPPQMAAVG